MCSSIFPAYAPFKKWDTSFLICISNPFFAVKSIIGVHSSSIMCREESTVWIVGSSHIYWLQRHLHATRQQQFASSLGLHCRVRWMGQRGMRWEELVPLLCTTPYLDPAVIVIHLGGNELGLLSGCSLLATMRRDLHKIHLIFPITTIVYSDIIQRREYRTRVPGINAYGIERARRLVNAGVAGFMGTVGISNTNLRHTMDCYQRDRVHLNHLGNDLFLDNVLVGLRRVV